MAIPVVVSPYGFPVRPVDANAPEMIVAENGIGTPITITDLGTPFIVRGWVLFTPQDLFADGEEGFWADLNNAMDDVTPGDFIGDKPGFWADLQEAI